MQNNVPTVYSFENSSLYTVVKSTNLSNIFAILHKKIQQRKRAFSDQLKFSETLVA